MSMTTELALIAKIKKQIESYDTVVLREDEANALLEALEVAEQERENWRNSFDNERFRADKLAAELNALRPVGVMSHAAYHRLENRESRFIALWPRPEIYLPRKRPDDGVIVYARTAGIQVIEGEQNNG